MTEELSQNSAQLIKHKVTYWSDFASPFCFFLDLFLGRPIRRGRPGRGRRRQPFACFRFRPRFFGLPRFGRVAISCKTRETNPPLRFSRPITSVSIRRLGPFFSAREIVTAWTPMHFATSLAKSPLSSRQRLSSSPVICAPRVCFHEKTPSMAKMS